MPFRLKALVAFHAAIVVIAHVVATGIQSLPLTWVAAGVFLGQIGLLSFWLAMGTSPLKRRLLGVVFATAYLSAVNVVWPLTGENRSSAWVQWFLLLVVVCQVLLWFFAAGLFVVRKWVSRVEHAPDTAMLPSATLQFTVFQLFLLTSVIAVLFGLHRGVGETNSMSGIISWLPLALMFVVWLVNLLCALWASLGNGTPWVRVPLVLVTATVLGGFFVTQEETGLQFGWLFYISPILLTLVPTTVVVASLLVVRSCGFRLLPVRWNGPFGVLKHSQD